MWEPDNDEHVERLAIEHDTLITELVRLHEDGMTSNVPPYEDTWEAFGERNKFVGPLVPPPHPHNFTVDLCNILANHGLQRRETYWGPDKKEREARNAFNNKRSILINELNHRHFTAWNARRV